jgi:hypothetical protein
MHDLNAPRRPSLLQAVSLTDEFRVLIGVCTLKKVNNSTKRDRYTMVVYNYGAMGVNDIPIPSNTSLTSWFCLFFFFAAQVWTPPVFDV